MTHCTFSGRLASLATGTCLLLYSLATPACFLLYGRSVFGNRNATIPPPVITTEASQVLPPLRDIPLRGSTRGGRVQLNGPRDGNELSSRFSPFATGSLPNGRGGSSHLEDDGRRRTLGSANRALLEHRDPFSIENLTGVEGQVLTPELVGRSIEGNVLVPELVNRCSNYELDTLAIGASCGEPLASPCFDFSRCRGASPTIYVYDPQCSLADSDELPIRGAGHSRWREAAREAGVLAPTYEGACLFVMLDRPHQKPCAMDAPLWHDGANHVLVDFGDRSRDRKMGFSNSFAMEAASSQHTCYYRSGYDLSLPLWPRKVFHDLLNVSPSDRKYLLTFKGTVYVGHRGFEERASVLRLHDVADGVVVAGKCWEHPRLFRPEHYEYCAEIGKEYDSFNYDELMDSTFGLVCGGASPGTYRLGEVMSAGSIPVFVVRDFVRPFREQIDWPSFSFMFTPDQVSRMIETLKAVPPDQLREMQRKSIAAYWEMFGGTSDHAGIARMGIKILLQRLRRH